MREFLWPGLRRRLSSHAGRRRRDAMKEALAATAGLLLSQQPARAASAGKRIVVVGAGFAGLACAHELAAVGYDVVVLEARDRIGGRVFSMKNFVQNRTMEFGGEFIGANHPTWVAYAKKFGLKLIPVDESDDPDDRVFIDGKVLDEKAAKELEDEVEKTLTVLTQTAAWINADEPWKSPNAARLDRRTMRDWIDSQKCSPKVQWYLSLLFGGENGTAVEAQSFLANLAPIKGGGLTKFWTESETHRCLGGNQQLAFKLAETIGEKRLLLSTPVKSIVQNSGRCVVQTADGRRFVCDDVVLAIPPSVWSGLTLDPALPFEGHPQMGVAVKWLARVDGRFWSEDEISSNALTNGDLNATWEGTKGQPGDGEAGLVGFSGGLAARDVLRREPKAREEWYRREMQVLYPGFSRHLLDSKFADWPSEAWTKGAYSFSAPGQVTTMGPVLRAGVGHVHFAGEHTCFAFTGYMEGGLNSGVSLARRLAERDRIAKNG